ncbi:MAG: glycosyltransferase, partial [Coprobacillus sp.]
DDTKVSKNDNIIISVGALEPVKGYERLITVAASVLKNHNNWKWEVYGEGDDQYKEKINALIAAEGLQGKIMLMGNTMDILSKYQNSKICVLTSRFEGLPMVLLEALSCGLPVVSFDIETGPNEIIINGVNGYLVEDNHEKEMIDKIEQLIDNEDELVQMATNAHESISKFSKNKVLKQWNKLIEEI